MKIKIKKLHEDAVIPKYASEGDAGMDLVAVSSEYNSRYNFTEYKTGLSFAIPEGYVGLLFPRSSVSKKTMSLCNAVGVLDSGFRGEVSFRFKRYDNRQDSDLYKKGDRIGQLIVIPYPKVEFEEVKELDETTRGTGGYGSTGE